MTKISGLADGDGIQSGDNIPVERGGTTKRVTPANVLFAPGTSSDPALAFDTWRTPNANRTTSVELTLEVATDGTSSGIVIVDVDESGGTTADYSRLTDANANAQNGFRVRQTVTVTIPAGGSYRVRNSSDPRSENAIEVNREFTL